MIKLEVTVDSMLMDLISNLQSLGGKALPNTSKAFKMASDIVANQWRDYALGNSDISGLEKLKNPKGGYAAGIKVEKVSDMHYRVVNGSKVAAFIEHGTPEHDMKKTHPYGPKSRVANKGTKANPRLVPYVIVPFRWGTPNGSDESSGHFRNIIPKDIYKMIQAEMKASRFIRTRIKGNDKIEPNYWGDEVRRNEYETEDGKPGWGSRLEAISGRIQGLTAFPTESGAEKRHSSYFTFRIISADSPAGSWIRPAQPARNVTRHIVNNTKDKVSNLIEAALKMDTGMGGSV